MCDDIWIKKNDIHCLPNSLGNFGRPRLAFANHASSSCSASPSSSMQDFSEHGLFIIACLSVRNHPHNISTPTPDANMKTIFNKAKDENRTRRNPSDYQFWSVRYPIQTAPYREIYTARLACIATFALIPFISKIVIL